MTPQHPADTPANTPPSPPRDSASHIATLSGITKTFPTRSSTARTSTARKSKARALTALDDVSLTIAPGEIIGLLGPNGAGKSTLIDLILELTTPTSGTVSVCGTSPRRAIAHSQVGAVLQTGGLLPDLTIEQTIRLISSTFPHPQPLDQILERADLTRIRSRKVQACSGGEQQRLRFALALIGAPTFLILDEPTAGMDPVARRHFWESMRVQASHGTTILFATHYLEEAQDFASRIVLLSQGRILADGTVDEIRNMTSSYTIQARFSPDATTPPTFLQHMDPNVSGLVSAVDELGHDTWQFTTTDSDALARYLLNHTAARDLRIAASSLDDAFVTLTESNSR
ncbi:ABC transporter ATP-binding protein [Corynebacterium falsenii DSM 44353]|uniref:ABC transporter ATP-binding protein n=1 Tax=Corynebacterium falsenii TaxID=108486 RepID=UPI0003E96A8F|nr:ABC transporter ATP-binding protein [Corynebacterium falsenii]AHI03425.1 ABC transporter ATP-binding protein [Corynebacterium falsenii DSM 44353]UBI04121.1 ABC transporter ATP-binding protein [Corynebacterium falsenii]